jgi:hypothetical protein
MPIQAAADNLRRELQERENEASELAPRTTDVNMQNVSSPAAELQQLDSALQQRGNKEDVNEQTPAKFVSAKKKLNDKKGCECFIIFCFFLHH